MKTQIEPRKEASALADAVATPRYQTYCQTRVDTFQAEYKTDSVAEVVEAFLHQSPGFEEGELRIWNHREQCVSASVLWRTQRSDFDFLLYHRTNEFHDRLLDAIARQLQERETPREILTHEARNSLAP